MFFLYRSWEALVSVIEEFFLNRLFNLLYIFLCLKVLIHPHAVPLRSDQFVNF